MTVYPVSASRFPGILTCASYASKPFVLAATNARSTAPRSMRWPSSGSAGWSAAAQITALAREMVTRYGMSETLGPLTFGELCKKQLVSGGNMANVVGFMAARAAKFRAWTVELVSRP